MAKEREGSRVSKQAAGSSGRRGNLCGLDPCFPSSSWKKNASRGMLRPWAVA